MGDRDEFLASETAEHLASTPPPAVSNTANVLPPRFEGRRNRSDVWNHFTAEQGTVKKARCNYCGSIIKFDNGTSSMRSHLPRCKNNPDKEVNKRQKSTSSSTVNVEGHAGSSPSIQKFDQDASRRDMVEMFINMEIPFRQVEHASFHKFMSGVQPKFKIPSRTTLARDILKLWDTEKTRLKKFFSQHCQRVCLTTDTWTSSQNFSYMCLTAHFIDNNWTLQKKILNFCQVNSHTGEVMAKTVEQCLNGWGLNRVLSLTVDNASSNDVGILHLKKRFASWNSLVMNGDYIHMRCCAHILNLIVKEGLKEIDDSILRIRAAVKFIRSSPSRLAKFKACAKEKNIAYKGSVCLDVETRWNSTYLMLDAALKHELTFDELEMKDSKYRAELQKGNGLPTFLDWEHVRSILPFLKLFYDATLRISGTSYVTSNIYMFEVLGIGKKIAQMCKSSDVRTSAMATNMKRKYDKYWGNPDTLNIMLLIALVLDPRRKLKFVEWMSNQTYDSGEVAALKGKLESCLKALFEEYNGGVEECGNSQEFRSNEEGGDDPYGISQFYQTTGCNKSESELGKYLEEALESNGDLDVLIWWKQNSSRFPILANIARDVLAIPVSTVASESAFSTGGRVLDPYRSSLSPTTVEALICTQDWLKGTFSTLLTNEDFENLEKFEQELVPPQDVAGYSGSIAFDDD